jgi:hypothetical protein
VAIEPLARAGLAAAVGLAGLADWLFYGYGQIGISLVLFVVATAVGVSLANPIRGKLGAVALGMAGVLALTLPFVVAPGIPSGVFAIVGLAVFTTSLTSSGYATIEQRVVASFLLLGDCGWRICADIASALTRRKKTSARHTNTLAAWAVPLALGSVFVALFASANPLIAKWLAAANPVLIIDWLNLPRIAFWLIVSSLVWPFVFVRARPAPDTGNRAFPSPASSGPPAATSRFLGTGSILRSLILFNALFAVQSVLDAAYLWGGVELPAGMSHAEYAHRGAYPLIVTALLAATFVIVALRPGGEAARSPLVRALVYLWVAQNVLLVLSSILRLDLYVATYSLTYWRIAAFVWMGLVAIGLLLIMARIAFDLPTIWLIRANLVSLTLALYVCSLPDFAAIIADYNVRHSAELTGTGSVLDRDYLMQLGEHAIPAGDLFLARAVLPDGTRKRMLGWRNTSSDAVRSKLSDWRAWNYSDWQLVRYLDRTPAPIPATEGGPASP